jgi:hypothetical protein
MLLPCLVDKQKKRNSDVFYNPSYAFTFSRSIETENRKTSLQGLTLLNKLGIANIKKEYFCQGF